MTTSDVDNYKQIKTDLDALRLLVEKSELWVYKSKYDAKSTDGEKSKSKGKGKGSKKVSWSHPTDSQYENNKLDISADSLQIMCTTNFLFI